MTNKDIMEVMGMDIESLYKAFDDHARQEAIGFAEWLHPDEDGNSWEMYDGHDRWINMKNDEVKSTSQLYEQYLQSKQQTP